MNFYRNKRIAEFFLFVISFVLFVIIIPNWILIVAAFIGFVFCSYCLFKDIFFNNLFK